MFARTTAGDSATRAAAVRALLEGRGLPPRDFDVDVDERSGIGALLGTTLGALTLRRRSTGELRVYPIAGPGWLAVIAEDLRRGYFRAGSSRHQTA